jgi:hypothetical protein
MDYFFKASQSYKPTDFVIKVGKGSINGPEIGKYFVLSKL